MQEFIKSFTQISSAEWLEILILLGVATILGFIIGWLLRSFTVRKLRGLLGAKTESYNALDKTHQEKLGFFREVEAENNEMTNRITVLNNEIKSLKLKLTNNNGTGALIENETAALALNDDEELIETEINTKPGWLQRIKSAFGTNSSNIVLENSNQITAEEKLDASNNMIERLLSSNEKLEDENEKLKQNILSLEENISLNKNNTTVKTEPVVVKQEIDVEKIDKYTNSLKDAKTTGKDLLKRIQELEIYNGKIIKQLEAETKEKNISQKQLLESGDYKTKYLELAPKFETVEIDNNKLKAQLAKLNSTTKTDILNLELKKKEDALAICKNEKQVLTQKLETTVKALGDCNKKQEDLTIKLETINKSKLNKPHHQPTAVTPSSSKVAAPGPSISKTKPIEIKKEEHIEKSVLEASHDIMTRIKNKAKSIDFSRIGTGDVNAKDDLKKVKGIGEFVEKKLNALGIYNFKQLAKLTEDDMDKVNDAIEFFPGRIKRDNWVAQAKKFAES